MNKKMPVGKSAGIFYEVNKSLMSIAFVWQTVSILNPLRNATAILPGRN
jgi:hypothetical protein